MQSISPTDLIRNADGSVYHLGLLPEQIADTIITVGDPDRVPKVSQYFDVVEFKLSKREFTTHTGRIGNQRLTVISTGMGTDNVEILMNELDALVNIDLPNLTQKSEHKSLNIIRIGTSGSIQKEVSVDSVVISESAFGIDGLNDFYDLKESVVDIDLAKKLQNHLNINTPPYFVNAAEGLLEKYKNLGELGTTLTCAGFYAPQGRTLRYATKNENLLDLYQSFNFDLKRLTNLEMETAGYYLFGKILGHNCISISAILANRILNQFSQEPEKQIDRLIQNTLQQIIT